MGTQGPSRKCGTPYKKMYLKHAISGIDVNPVEMTRLCNLRHADRPKSVYIRRKKRHLETHTHFVLGKYRQYLSLTWKDIEKTGILMEENKTVFQNSNFQFYLLITSTVTPLSYELLQ